MGGVCLHGIQERLSILQVERHENARHDRKVIRHVTFVTIAEVGPHVRWQLVRFSEQHPIGSPGVYVFPDCLDDGVCLEEVLAGRAVALDQVRHRIETKPVDTQIQPEVEHRQHLAHHRRIVVIQVRLMVKEPVPVVRLGNRIPRPVGRLCVDEDDPRLRVTLVGIAPHVVIALGRAWRR